MRATTALVLVKLAHTAAWALFAGAIVATAAIRKMAHHHEPQPELVVEGL